MTIRTLALLMIAGTCVMEFSAFPARADVALTIMTQPAREVPCPNTRPVTIRNMDGTYSRREPAAIAKPTETCFLPPQYTFEVWSDYPERGGHYVRTIKAEGK